VIGSYLDPLADKVLICCTAAALAHEVSLPLPYICPTLTPALELSERKHSMSAPSQDLDAYPLLACRRPRLSQICRLRPP